MLPPREAGDYKLITNYIIDNRKLNYPVRNYKHATERHEYYEYYIKQLHNSHYERWLDSEDK